MKMPMQFIRSDSLVVDDEGQLGLATAQVNTRSMHAFHSPFAWRNGNMTHFKSWNGLADSLARQYHAVAAMCSAA